MRKVSGILFFILHSSFFIYCPAQIITTIAGNGLNGLSGDGGPATMAEFYSTSGIALDDSGNIYVADLFNNRIRKITASTGIINTIAGAGAGYQGDGGPATAALLNGPRYIALDGAGDVCFSDAGNCVIRKVTISTGIISTIVGNGYIHRMVGLPSGWGGYAGDGGQATDAELNTPQGLTFDDSDNMFIADANNNVVRKVTTSTGIITTIVGNGYNASAYGSQGGYSGDGGLAIEAELNFPSGVAVDSVGNIYVADCLNSKIREVFSSTGIINTMAGNGYGEGLMYGGYSGDGGQATLAELYYPTTVSFDGSGNMLISDSWNNVIRIVQKSTGIISTIAGNGYLAGSGFGVSSGDGGPATAAELNGPVEAIVDARGNMFISDGSSSRIRKVTYDTNAVTGNKLIATSEGLRVFPNPSNGTFIIQSSVVSRQWSVEVYNVLGEQVYLKSYQLSANGYQLDISSQPDGIYLYRVLTENGELVGQGKVVIEK